jgi:CheY-like chemotaxis protein/MinD-like ATPase involved in chromosome partitioning or flagellar assembly
MAKILVVDDDHSILRLLKFTLTHAGHAPILCSDAQQGLVEVQNQKPDLIIADVMMPKMHGYQFCKEVRAMPEAKDIPVIMFSARFQPIDRQTAIDAGASDYLPKIISNEKLIQRIEELLPQTASSKEVANGCIGLLSLRGGTGVTSLAVNISVALAGALKIEPALVDLQPYGGHAALMLGLRVNNYLSKVLADDLTLDALKPYIVQHSCGIKLLASAGNHGAGYSLPSESVAKLVELLKSEFRFSIIDLPAFTLEADFNPVLKQLTKIILILSPDLPSLQSTVLTMQGLIQQGIAKENIILIVNQVMPQGNLPLEAMQKALRTPVATTIPYEPDMIQAINSRQPLLLKSPKSAGSAAIARLANLLRM